MYPASPGSRRREEEETQKCLCPALWAAVIFCPGTPGQAFPFNPEESGNFPTLPAGAFPLPNYIVGAAGIQPGPQIPALGRAQTSLSAINTLFGAEFLGGFP